VESFIASISLTHFTSQLLRFTKSII